MWKNVSSRRILSGVILVESSRTGFRGRRGRKEGKRGKKEREIIWWTACVAAIHVRVETFFPQAELTSGGPLKEYA